MGATSVTGVGLGDSYHGQKGPGNGRNVFQPLLGANVIAAGRADLAAGVATVTFPTALLGHPDNYVVLLMSETANAVNLTAKDGDDLVTPANSTTFVNIDVAGTGTDSFGWVVVSAGNA